MRFCNECNKEKHCNRCKSQINEIREFESNINLLKRQAPDQYGHMLPYFKE